MSSNVLNPRVSAAPVACPPEPNEAKAEKGSYGQILKSTAWVGGSSGLNILIRIARTKAMALLLGPAGFGLVGLYMSVANVAQSIAGLGINSSGVRQIAEAVGSGDTDQISRTTIVLRRVSFALGLIGALLVIALAGPISRATFGTDQHVAGLYLLAGSVFFTLVSAGQGALIQGMRRISDLAKMSVLGSLFGTVATVAILYAFREDGIVPSLVAAAVLTLLTSWWYSRKIEIKRPSINYAQVRDEVGALLKLGSAFMVSSVLVMGSAYVIRIIVLHKTDLEATGIYQAAWTLGGFYVGIILQSMGADFYPRLTAIVADHDRCNRLVNEQTRVSLLLAGPGVIATLTFAPQVISLLYAAGFAAAVEPLRWICLGIAMRVISWPMGFIIMAKGRKGLIILTESAWTAVHLGLAWILVERFGVTGAGVAFFGSYVFHIGMTYAIVRTLSGFRWSAENRQTILLYLALITVVFSGLQWLPTIYASILGTLATALSGIYSLRVIVTLTNGRIPQALQGFASRFGLTG